MRAIAIALFAAISLSCLSATSEKETAINKPKTEEKKPESNNTQYQAAPALTINNFSTPNTETKGHDKKPNDHGSPTAEEELALWTKILAIFTGALVVVTGMVWRATNSLFKDAKESSKRNLRAYVCLKDFDANYVMNASGSARTAWVISPAMVNMGNTPARNCTNHANYLPMKDRLADSFDFKDGETPKEFLDYKGKTWAMVGPQVKLSLGRHVIPIEECLAMFRNERHGYLYGWIEYDDVFPGTDRHRTEFCCEIFMNHDPRVCESSDFGFIPYRRYNGADEDCIYPPPKRPRPPWYKRLNPFS